MTTQRVDLADVQGLLRYGFKHHTECVFVAMRVRDRAAARAWLDSADSLPLLRLVAEVNTAGVDEPVDFSYGLYTAVSCTDYPLLYDLNASRAVRNHQYAAALQDARASNLRAGR